MIDIETTGTRPDRAAIIQIAAVKFNFETGDVDPEYFDRCLWPMPHRGWDDDTRAWWMKYKSVLSGIQARAEDPAVVLQAFADWVGRSEKPIRMWAKPISFEWPFIESHFHDAGIKSPFHYRYSVDSRSWMSGALGVMDRNKVNETLASLEFEGPPHNAIYDVFHQLKEVFHIKKLAERSA